MKLSEIQTSARYPVIIPSTGMKTTYRPFLVKEEKALLIAQNSEDIEVQLITLESIVRACVADCPANLTTFDVEYLFVLFRNQAVGELAESIATCGQCGDKSPVNIDLSKVTVTDKLDTKLVLSPSLIVEMQYPSITDLTNLAKINDPLKRKFATITIAMKTVHFEDSVFHLNEMSTEEIEEFIDNRTDDEFTILNHWIENIPTVTIRHPYTCEKCNTKNVIELKTLSDFF